MKAMILAAGLGTRLKPITDNLPKALVEIEGVTMLERLILNLKFQGFDYIVVNVHHFADKIEAFIRSHDFGVTIDISDERKSLLDTGGGIVNAKDLLFKYDNHPFLVHNVDILSNACLPSLFSGDEATTLLVSDRMSNRKLIFDKQFLLKGWLDSQKNIYRPEDFIPEPDYKEFAFSGIYVMNKEAVEEMEELKGKGKFSVMDYFLDPNRVLKVKGFQQEGLFLLDIGKPATLLQASEILKDLSIDY